VNAPPFVPGRLSSAGSLPLAGVAVDTAQPARMTQQQQQQMVAMAQQPAPYYYHLHPQQQQGMPGYHLQYHLQQLRPAAGLPPLPPMHPPAGYGLQAGVLFPLPQPPLPPQQQEVQYVLVTPMAPDAGPSADHVGAEGSSSEDAESAGGSGGTDDGSLPGTASYAHSEASDNSNGMPGEHSGNAGKGSCHAGACHTTTSSGLLLCWLVLLLCWLVLLLHGPGAASVPVPLGCAD
jgi:hypothetical protein